MSNAWDTETYVICDYYNSENYPVKLTDDQFKAICWFIEKLGLEYNCYTLEEFEKDRAECI